MSTPTAQQVCDKLKAAMDTNTFVTLSATEIRAIWGSVIPPDDADGI